MARGRATTKKQAAAGAAAVVAEEKAENGVAQNGEGTPTRLVLADCMPIFFSLLEPFHSFQFLNSAGGF